MAKFDLTKSFEPKPFLDLFSLGMEKAPTYEDAEAVIIPFGYEGTVTFGHGTDKGPQGLIEASWQVETFDDELLDDVQNQIRIWTTQQPKLPKDAEEACTLMETMVDQIIKDRKLPVAIGGEHTISYGFARGLALHHSDISVLVFDSHMDLGDRWSPKPFTHAAWLKYTLEKLPNEFHSATLVGIRNYNKLEYEFWKNNLDRVTVFEAKEKKTWKIEAILDSLKENVYISFDIDAFDSSVMPATGTPEPGGLFWDEIMPILREVCAKKNVVGMDIVELAPIEGMHAPDFLAAKLLLKMLIYKYKAKQFIDTKSTY